MRRREFDCVRQFPKLAFFNCTEPLPLTGPAAFSVGVTVCWASLGNARWLKDPRCLHELQGCRPGCTPTKIG